jgi:hypothetical protein
MEIDKKSKCVCLDSWKPGKKGISQSRMKLIRNQKCVCLDSWKPGKKPRNHCNNAWVLSYLPPWMEFLVCFVFFFFLLTNCGDPNFFAQKLLLPQAENEWALGLENRLYNFRNSQFYLCLGIPEKRWVPVYHICLTNDKHIARMLHRLWTNTIWLWTLDPRLAIDT